MSVSCCTISLSFYSFYKYLFQIYNFPLQMITFRNTLTFCISELFRSSMTDTRSVIASLRKTTYFFTSKKYTLLDFVLACCAERNDKTIQIKKCNTGLFRRIAKTGCDNLCL